MKVMEFYQKPPYRDDDIRYSPKKKKHKVYNRELTNDEDFITVRKRKKHKHTDDSHYSDSTASEKNSYKYKNKKTEYSNSLVSNLSNVIKSEMKEHKRIEQGLNKLLEDIRSASDSSVESMVIKQRKKKRKHVPTNIEVLRSSEKPTYNNDFNADFLSSKNNELKSNIRSRDKVKLDENYCLKRKIKKEKKTHHSGDGAEDTAIDGHEKKDSSNSNPLSSPTVFKKKESKNRVSPNRFIKVSNTNSERTQNDNGIDDPNTNLETQQDTIDMFLGHLKNDSDKNELLRMKNHAHKNKKIDDNCDSEPTEKTKKKRPHSDAGCGSKIQTEFNSGKKNNHSYDHNLSNKEMEISNKTEKRYEPLATSIKITTFGKDKTELNIQDDDSPIKKEKQQTESDPSMENIQVSFPRDGKIQLSYIDNYGEKATKQSTLNSFLIKKKNESNTAKNQEEKNLDGSSIKKEWQHSVLQSTVDSIQDLPEKNKDEKSEEGGSSKKKKRQHLISQSSVDSIQDWSGSETKQKSTDEKFKDDGSSQKKHHQHLVSQTSADSIQDLLEKNKDETSGSSKKKKRQHFVSQSTADSIQAGPWSETKKEKNSLSEHKNIDEKSQVDESSKKKKRQHFVSQSTADSIQARPWSEIKKEKNSLSEHKNIDEKSQEDESSKKKKRQHTVSQTSVDSIQYWPGSETKQKSTDEKCKDGASLQKKKRHQQQSSVDSIHGQSDSEIKKENTKISLHKRKEKKKTVNKIRIKLKNNLMDDAEVDYEVIRNSIEDEKSQEPGSSKTKKRLHTVSQSSVDSIQGQSDTEIKKENKYLSPHKSKGKKKSIDKIRIKFKSNLMDDTDVDYEVIRDSIELANQNRLSDQHRNMLQQLAVEIPWPIPESHLIETRMSTHPSKAQQVMFKERGFEMRTDHYDSKEDRRIMKNWRKFCKLHNLAEDPQPFLAFEAVRNCKIKGSVLPHAERIKFVRFLGHGLPHRCLFSIYKRFKKLFNVEKKGKFSPTEDSIILNYLRNSDDTHKFAQLGHILNRDRHAVLLRFKTLGKKYGLRYYES